MTDPIDWLNFLITASRCGNANICQLRWCGPAGFISPRPPTGPSRSGWDENQHLHLLHLLSSDTHSPALQGDTGSLSSWKRQSSAGESVPTLLRVPVSARLCAHPWPLVCHLVPVLAKCSQLPGTGLPPSGHNGSLTLAVLKRPVVNEQNQQRPVLVLHLPAL